MDHLVVEWYELKILLMGIFFGVMLTKKFKKTKVPGYLIHEFLKKDYGQHRYSGNKTEEERLKQ
jgi:hypothetical protein